MDQRRGLESVACGFVGHALSGELAQFPINKGEQFIGGLGVSPADGVQDARDFFHAQSLRGLALMTKSMRIHAGWRRPVRR